MKCDELEYERLGDANKTYPASTLVIRKQFVDAAIAELKCELSDARDDARSSRNLVNDKNEEINELKDRIQQKDFFWEGCRFSKMGFKNTIDVANYVEELRADNESLRKAVSNWHDKYCNLQETIDRLECKLECVKENKDKELRATNRALWLARATIAHSTKYKYHRLSCKAEIDPQPHGWSCYINGEVYRTGKMNRKLEPHYWIEIWEEVERKCRAKAEADK